MKPTIAIASVVVAAAIGGYVYYKFHHVRETETTEPSKGLVIVTKATKACFSDLVRVTGFVVPHREAMVGVDQDGLRIGDVLVKEGDKVTDGQEVVRLQPGGSAASAQSGNPSASVNSAANARPSPVSLRAPQAGTVIQVSARPGAIASPQLGPLVRIAADDQLELDAEVPGTHVLKLKPGAPARILLDGGSEIGGTVRLIAPVIDPRTQLGHVRIAIARTPALKIGMFVRAAIDANRSCGVSIPRSAVDHAIVQVVRNNIVETRRVQTGLVAETSVEIRDGVKEDEIVVANAGTSLHDGDRIKMMFADDSTSLGSR